MTLHKPDLARVTLPGKLYRGDNQWKFEFAALKSMLQASSTENTAYWGYEKNIEGKVTFCNETLDKPTYFALAERVTRGENEDNLFTYSPLIFEIDASKYNLYLSTKGEGYVIRDQVSLDDITILYSSRKNNLSSLPQTMIDELDNTKTGKDLFTNYEKNPEFLEGYIKMALGSSGNPQNLQNYVKTLKDKLG